MSRVYLMALRPFGGKPYSLGVVNASKGRNYPAISGKGGNGLYLNDRQRFERARSRAWWLVEAESAEAARAIIATMQHVAKVPRGASMSVEMPPGRILDSGGAASPERSGQ